MEAVAISATAQNENPYKVGVKVEQFNRENEIVKCTTMMFKDANGENIRDIAYEVAYRIAMEVKLANCEFSGFKSSFKRNLKTKLTFIRNSENIAIATVSSLNTNISVPQPEIDLQAKILSSLVTISETKDELDDNYNEYISFREENLGLLQANKQFLLESKASKASK